ncbi:response regulator [Chelativorans sp. YIM 93263]|uniref:response regulator n=1 Tax=Chelativorans sp. YIM 93263 TaxID=2906648 RepID=UPI002379F3F8|nr:response regulator [Chelativorans sp. YIM 93263]
MSLNTTTTNYDGLRVYVVEDEALVAMNLEMILEELGCVIAATAMRFDQAEQMINEGIEADVAILDVNLGGLNVFPLAERLIERGIPVVFATGYDESGIDDAWHGTPTLQKPYTAEDVDRGLAMVLAARQS